MAVTSGFFNSVNHDRLYDATQISSMFDGIIAEGVLSAYGDKMMVSPEGGMMVNVGSGKAWFNHTWTLNDSNHTITLTESDPIKKRMDLICLEINNEKRNNSIKLKKGEEVDPSAEYIKPSLVNNLSVKQYPLAYIEVKPGATEITKAEIENAVGTKDCPFASGVLQQVTVQQLYQQWGAQFLQWWDDVKVVMSDDVAGKLQNEIDELRKWTKPVTIKKGANTTTVNNPSIKVDSLIDIYYKNEDIAEVSKRNPTYTQTDGKLTIVFSDKLSKDVVIEAMHINNAYYPI